MSSTFRIFRLHVFSQRSKQHARIVHWLLTICNTWFTCLFSVIRANVYFPLAPWAGEHPKYREVTPEDPWAVEDHWTRESLSGRPGTLHLENRFIRTPYLCRTSALWREKLKCISELTDDSYTSLRQSPPTLLYDNYFPALLYNALLQISLQKQTKTLFQLFFEKLSSNTPSLHFSATHVSNTSLPLSAQHPSPTLLHNTLLQLFSATLFPTSLRNTSLQHPFPRFLYNMFVQHPCSGFPLNSSNTTAAKHHARKTTKQYRRTQIIRKLSGFDNWLPATVSCIHTVQTWFQLAKQFGVLLQRAQIAHAQKFCLWSSPRTDVCRAGPGWRMASRWLKATQNSCCVIQSDHVVQKLLISNKYANTIRKHTCICICLRYFLCIIQTILWYCTWYTNVFYVFKNDYICPDPTLISRPGLEGVGRLTVKSPSDWPDWLVRVIISPAYNLYHGV